MQVLCGLQGIFLLFNCQTPVIQLKSLEAFAKAADGKATKIIIPSEIQSLAGMVKSVTEIGQNEEINV